MRSGQATPAEAGVPLDAVRIGHLHGDYHDPRCAWLRHRQIASDGAILVRPDRFIAWRHPAAASHPRATLAAALSQILARPVGTPAAAAAGAISFPAVFCPAVGDQRADEQQGHPGRRGHAQGMPPQADHVACGGGEFGCPDEPVAGPEDTEVRGGLPHLGLAGQLAGRGEQRAAGSSSEMVTNPATSWRGSASDRRAVR